MHRAALSKNSIKITFNKNGKAVPVKFPKKKRRLIGIQEFI